MDYGPLTLFLLNYVEFNKGDGHSNSFKKFSYATPGSSKRCKGSRDYLISIRTLSPSPIKWNKCMPWLVTGFVDDGPLTPLLIRLCEN